MNKKYKICILGNTTKDISKSFSWFVLTTYQGLRLLGHEVVGLDYKSNSFNKIYNSLLNYKPDILFTHLTFHNFHKTEKMLELFDILRHSFDTKVIHSVQDARTVPRYNGDISYAFDLALVGQRQTLKKLSKIWKIPTYYCAYSSLTYSRMGVFRPELYFDGLPVFTGNPDIHTDRKNFVKLLQRNLPIKIINTNSHENLRHNTLDLSASCNCVLGLCTGYNINGYIDVRPFQYLGAGAFFIGRKFKKMENVIPDKYYIPFHNYSEKDALFIKEQTLKWRKKNKNPMRNTAFTFIQKYHSSKVRMQNVLNLIEGKQETTKSLLEEI